MENDNIREYTILDDELKNYLLSDKLLTHHFLIYLFHKTMVDNDGDKPYLKEEYDLYNNILSDNVKTEINQDGKLKEFLLDTYKSTLNDFMIDDIYTEYTELANNEGKQLIYTLSKLLYIQNKYKDEEIGQQIDSKIKEWLKLVNDFDKEKNIKCYRDLSNLLQDTTKTKEERVALTIKYNNMMRAHLFYQIIPSLNYDIYNNKNNRPFTTIWKQNTNKKDIYTIIRNYINNKVEDVNSYYRYIVLIADFLEEIESNINMANFERDKAKEIQAIKDKYGVKDYDKDNTILKKENEDAYLDELAQEYHRYLSEGNKEFLLQDNKDIDKWRDKAEKFINHLETYKDNPTFTTFNIDYMLDHLAYSDYQKTTYKTECKHVDSEEEQEQTKQYKKLSKNELNEKYKDITLLEDDSTLNYNRKWGRVDTSKVNSNVMVLRESLTKIVNNNPNLTETQIKEIEKKAKKTKEDLLKLKDLKVQKEEQEQTRQETLKELDDLKDDIALIDKQLESETDARQVKKLNKRRKEISNKIDSLKDTLAQNGLHFQLNTDGQIVYEKVNKRKKETYKLMVNADYNIQNFNSEGRNFLLYIPNIKGVINQLNDDFIVVDIDDFIDFTGRPNTNISRVRRNLLNTLIEMRKESYDYSFYDEKGQLQEGSLILIGDVKSTEFRGKATIKVQLGATFKQNLKQAFNNNQIANVNKDVFKLGQGKNYKAENMAKELFIYFSQMARTEAKKGTINGEWQKDLHLDTLITRLSELNLINYNPNTYNKSVKEPLQYALNTGVELGLFRYETNAFKYYDDVIATGNNGAYVKDKISNFESGKKYGIRIFINGSMIDLEKNEKAHDTYNKYKNKKQKKRATE